MNPNTSEGQFRSSKKGKERSVPKGNTEAKAYGAPSQGGRKAGVASRSGLHYRFLGKVTASGLLTYSISSL
jgi:hypothetical protein